MSGPLKIGTVLLGATLAVTNASCTGDIGDEGSTPDDGVAGPADAEFANMRRMTPVEFENTMRDLFGDAELELDLDADAGQVITLLAVDKLNAAAETIVSRRSSWTEPVFPCDTSGAEDVACVDAFIRTFGRRAFRRTLDEADVALLMSDYDRARASLGFEQSLLVVLQTMIQSPEVYYFLELGRAPVSGEDVAAGAFPLTGWERASRLSYFLWNSMPDDALLDAAEAGELETREGVETETARMLAHPRARATLIGFFSDWLELEGTNKHSGLADAQKSAELFPEDSQELRAAMRTEIEALVERVLFEGDGRIETLLTTTDAYVDGPLATLYGVDGPSVAGDFAWVKLPADQRAGIFTRAAFLTVFAGNEVKSPIRRGAYLLEGAMCAPLGPPPPNASDVPVKGGDVDEGGSTVQKTIREDVEAKTSSADCVGCHTRINPIGFAFEHYDALGRWMDRETGEGETGPYSLEIDASGTLPGAGPDSDVQVDGAIEMSEALANSDAVRVCLAQNLFETALRRLPIDRDLASVEASAPLIDADATILDAVVALTTSGAFLTTRREQE